MKALKILAIDPGFASLGWAVVSFTSDGPVCEAAGVFRTKPDRTKLKYNDNVDRARRLYDHLSSTADDHDIRIIAAEAQSWTRFSNADRSIATVFGLLAALGVETSAPIVQLSPQDVKLRVCGKKTASKEDIKQAVYQIASGSREFIEGIRASTQREHAADAVAVALAAFQAPIVYGIASVLGLTTCTERYLSTSSKPFSI